MQRCYVSYGGVIVRFPGGLVLMSNEKEVMRIHRKDLVPTSSLVSAEVMSFALTSWAYPATSEECEGFSYVYMEDSLDWFYEAVPLGGREEQRTFFFIFIRL